MIAVIQRVTKASVTVGPEIVGHIDRGILALIAVHKTDTADDIEYTSRKLLELRIFPAGEKNFDQDVTQIQGSILLVSNFTVAAETRKGRRPSFDAAAEPVTGSKLFDELISRVRASGMNVQTGRFGADMQVSIVNDGPATFIVDSRKPKSEI